MILLYSDCSALGDKELVIGYMSFLKVACLVWAVEADEAAIIAGHSAKFLMLSPKNIWCMGTSFFIFGSSRFFTVYGIFVSIILIESRMA